MWGIRIGLFWDKIKIWGNYLGCGGFFLVKYLLCFGDLGVVKICYEFLILKWFVMRRGEVFVEVDGGCWSLGSFVLGSFLWFVLVYLI